MAFTEKITLMVDVVTGNAKSGLGKIKSDMAGVDGAFNKMKVGAKGAFDTIGVMGPQVALAAGAALVGFGAKAVSAFQSTALAADKFADSTGLGVEEASKWIAVADDVDVSAGTIQTAFVKMEKAIATNKEAFGDLIAVTETGATDLSGTFLNVIEHLQGIKDPIERANESAKLFGRGFAEVSEIITTDAGKLETALAGVSDAQIIDEAEVKKAREFQAAMDTLGDSVRDVALALGENLVPTLTDLAALATDGIEIVVNVKSDFEKVDEQTGGWMGRIASQVNQTLNPIERLKTSVNTLKDAFGQEATAADTAAGATGRVADSKNRAWVATQNLAAAETAAIATTAGMVAAKGNEQIANQNVAAALVAANDALAANINLQLAAIDATFAVTNAHNNFLTAVQAAGVAVDDTSTAVNEQQVAMDAATQAAIAEAGATVALAQQQATLEGKTLSAEDSQQILIGTLRNLASQASGPVASAIGGVITKLQAVAAQQPKPTVSINDQASGPIANVNSRLDGLDGRTVTSHVNVLTGGALNSINAVQAAFNRLPRNFTGTVPTGASGFQNFAGGLALVGEQGPELVNLPRGSDVFTAAETRGFVSGSASALPRSGGGGGGGGSISIHFHGPVLGTKAEFGRYIDEALAESRRRGNRVA